MFEVAPGRSLAIEIEQVSAFCVFHHSSIRAHRTFNQHFAMTAFWHFLIWACVIWYSTITIYVAVRGVSDIRSMLKRLREGAPPEEV